MGSHRGQRRAAPSVEHGHGHGHAHGDGDVAVERGPRLIVVTSLAVVLLAVLAGLVLMWPDEGKVATLSDKLDFAVDGVAFPHGTIHTVDECPPDDTGQVPCGILTVDVDDDGPRVTVDITTDVLESGLAPGDRVQLQRLQTEGAAEPTYVYYETDRGPALWLFVGLFVLAVVAVARLRGLLALVGLGFGMLVIGGWLIPSLLSGHSPLLVGLVGSAAILYVVLYLAHGVSMRTSAALLGTLGGLLVTALLGLLATRMSRLSGVSDDHSSLLSQTAPELSFQALMICTIVIAGLGVLNDVTITQASAVWELRAASPTMSRWHLWTSGMRIGRDHIASTIYTIVFAYAGTALLTLLLLSLYDRPILEVARTEQLAEEIVRSLVSSIGLVLAVPLTTALAAVTVPGPVTD